MTYGLRLVAYTPYGDRLGILPQPLRFTWTLAEFGYAKLTVAYPEEGAWSEWCHDAPEVALEWGDPLVPGSFEEADFCRHRTVSAQWDRLDKTRVWTYTLAGLGQLLDRMRVWDSDDQDPADGPVKPVRTFGDVFPGQMMVPLWNAAIPRHFPTHTDPPTKGFELLTDHNAVTWPTELEGPTDLSPGDPLARAQEMLIEAALAEPAWSQRRYRLYVWNTYGTDVSEGDDPVTFVDTVAVKASPESRDYDNMAARIMVLGEDGQFVERVNIDADITWGSFEDVLAAGGSHSIDGMNKLATAAIRRGSAPAEQLTREWVASDVGPLPFRDYHIRWKVRLDRGPTSDDTRFVKPTVSEISLTWDAKAGISGHTKFNDRRERREAAAFRRLKRLAEGTKAGPLPGNPGSDVRAPAAPTGVTVTTTTFADENNKTKATQLIEWDAVTDDIAVPPVAISLRGYEIGEKRFGITARIAEVGPAQLSWERGDVTVGARDLKVRAVSKTGFASAWSADVDGQVVREEEPHEGLNKVTDARWVNPPIRASRIANAGAGFTFATSSSRMRAQFTSTTPVLRSRIAGTSDGGWVPVEAGQKWLVGGSDRRVGSSAANARYGYQWRDAAGTVTEVDNAGTHTCTTSDVRSVYEVTIPSGAVEAAWKAKATGTLTSTTVEIIDPIFERRTSNERIEDAAVTGGAAGAGVKIAANTITFNNIAANTIRANEIAANTITAAQIAAGTITSNEIAANTITAADIAAGTITATEIDSGISLTVFFLDASGGDFGALTTDAFGLQVASRGPYNLPASPTNAEIASLLSAFGLANLV